ncbi:MAG: helix-turn-helix domain-containing protein [Clostridia bacterium]|nr:helix-turn-helix domain-containing protein [Clostridia bacterium]
MDNKIIGQRLRDLRQGVKLSQMKLCSLNGNISQSALNRYENGISEVSNEVLLWYANYFDVSLDYIFGRTDNPQGKLYDYQPKVWQDNEQMQEFIEMCFDPSSAANAKLKEAVLKLLRETNS